MVMLRNKKQKRTLSQIGKRRYDFDIILEKRIYYCLCCSFGSKKALKKLDDNLKFNSYQQWEQYICNKYMYYSKNDLIEFSRYLNQKIRDLRTDRDYWNIMATVALTLLLTNLLENIFDTYMNISVLPMLANILTSIFVVVFFIVAIIIFVTKTLYPILENNINKNFFKDYKEVIDNLIISKN